MTTENTKTKNFIFNKLPDWLMMLNLPIIGYLLIFDRGVFDSLFNRFIFGTFLMLSGIWWFLKQRRESIERKEKWNNIANELDKPTGRFGQ